MGQLRLCVDVVVMFTICQTNLINITCISLQVSFFLFALLCLLYADDRVYVNSTKSCNLKD